MTHQQILDFVLNYIKEHFKDQVTEINPNTELLTTRLFDSISTLHMVSDMEEHFKFEAEAHEVSPENLNTPLLIANYIGRKLGI